MLALQRLAASPAGQEPQPQQQFVSDEERRLYIPEQLVFLERKRRAAAGLGPVMPDSSACMCCGGSGQTICHQCGGSGMNGKDRAAEIFTDERGLVLQHNGQMDSRYFFMAEAPCWLCRGQGAIGCGDCNGSGLHGIGEGFVTD